MTIETFHNNPKGFRERVLPYLMEAEAENNLLIGISGRLAGATTAIGAGDAFFCLAREGETISGAACWTPPHDLVLSHPLSAPALAELARSISENHLSLPGVLGPDYAAEEFVRLWSSATGARNELWRRERVYRLDTVETPPLAPGRLIPAAIDDRAILLRWIGNFMHETGEQGDAAATFDRMLSQHTLYVWWDGWPVSMAAMTGTTPNGIRINFVYTPPDLRRRGYATAAVSALSSLLLAQGKSFCALYTDLANPTSNSIYQRIGYKPILDCYHYRFVS